MVRAAVVVDTRAAAVLLAVRVRLLRVLVDSVDRPAGAAADSVDRPADSTVGPALLGLDSARTVRPVVAAIAQAAVVPVVAAIRTSAAVKAWKIRRSLVARNDDGDGEW